MYYDRFDICEAYYCWLSDNHEGQWSASYKRLCKLGRTFSPRPNLSYATLEENARAIYDNIRAR